MLNNMRYTVIIYTLHTRQTLRPTVDFWRRIISDYPYVCSNTDTIGGVGEGDFLKYFNSVLPFCPSNTRRRIYKCPAYKSLWGRETGVTYGRGEGGREYSERFSCQGKDFKFWWMRLAFHEQECMKANFLKAFFCAQICRDENSYSSILTLHNNLELLGKRYQKNTY